jgi:hypothetical protein
MVQYTRFLRLFEVVLLKVALDVALDAILVQYLLHLLEVLTLGDHQTHLLVSLLEILNNLPLLQLVVGSLV